MALEAGDGVRRVGRHIGAHRNAAELRAKGLRLSADGEIGREARGVGVGRLGAHADLHHESRHRIERENVCRSPV